MTGANSGIGKAVALAMGRAGADVVVNYVAAPEAAEEVAGEIRGFGRQGPRPPRRREPGGRGPGDVRPDVEEFGTVDIVVANAGLQRDAPFERDDARSSGTR